MRVISVRQQPQYLEIAIAYFQKHWSHEDSKMVYDDCIRSSMQSPQPLPQWYLLEIDQKIIGGVGLITNDFISRMDLYPWICALYIEAVYRGHHYGSYLIQKAKEDAALFGFTHVYIASDHIGYYEQYGFQYIATGYHPWNEASRIYESKTTKKDYIPK